MMNYIIFRIAESFFYLEKIGYYYIKNKLSITNNLFNKTPKRINMVFKYLKLILKYTKNNKYEKDMVNHLFTFLNKIFDIEKRLSNLKSDFNFYYEIINNYINSKFIKNENRYILEFYKHILKSKFHN